MQKVKKKEKRKRINSLMKQGKLEVFLNLPNRNSYINPMQTSLQQSRFLVNSLFLRSSLGCWPIHRHTTHSSRLKSDFFWAQSHVKNVEGYFRVVCKRCRLPGNLQAIPHGGWILAGVFCYGKVCHNIYTWPGIAAGNEIHTY